MYNRYIPQPDGSYRRSKYPDQRAQERPKPSPPPPPPPKEPPPQECKEQPCQQCQCVTQRQNSGNISNFFRNILPKDFDTGDLIIVLLLLLMASDCEEDQNTALLTMALYFIM